MARRIRLSFWIYFGAIGIAALATQAQGIRWLAIRQLNPPKWDGAACREGRLRAGLSARQAGLCRVNVAAPAPAAAVMASGPAPASPGTPASNTPSGIMPLLERAASLAVSTCQAVLADRRWNCSSLELTPKLGPDLTGGTREQAFAFALASAAVTHTMARACAQGALFQCSCAAPPRDAPDGDFKWGGCGDNVRWGASYAKQWTDAASGRRRRKPGSPGPAKPPKTRNKTAPAGRRTKRKRRPVGSALLAMVNQHNSRAGWRAVESSVATQCKCHGVSGSCSIKTCWRALPRLSDIGVRLLRRFASAVEVEGRRPAGAAPRRLVAVLATGSGMAGGLAPGGSNGPLSVPPPPPPATGRRFSAEDLVFVTKSPDYCEPDQRTGSAGTRGRTCNATSSGYDSCTNMCCGRGFHTVIIQRTEMCQCQHVWCCYVRCNTCEYMIDTHVCN